MRRPDGWTGPAVAFPAEVVPALALRVRAAREAPGARRDRPGEPVRVDLRRREILRDERERPRAARGCRPAERRRDVGAVAGEARRYRAARPEGRAREPETASGSARGCEDDRGYGDEEAAHEAILAAPSLLRGKVDPAVLPIATGWVARSPRSGSRRQSPSRRSRYGRSRRSGRTQHERRSRRRTRRFPSTAGRRVPGTRCASPSTPSRRATS